MPTRPTQVRLTDQELERVHRLKARFGIRSTADVIRVALAMMEDSRPVRNKSEKNPRVPLDL